MAKRIYTKEEFIALLRDHIHKSHNGSNLAFSKSLNYSSGTFVSNVINGTKEPSPAILEALGFEPARGYFRK